MRKIIAAVMLLSASATLQAEEARFVSDGSPLSEVCMAALGSPAAARSRAAELGLGKQELRDLACNGKPWLEFANRTEKTVSGPVLYALQAGDASPETELCVAAVRSKAEFERAKRRYFSQDLTVEKELRCNRQPLDAFVSRYRNRSLNASL